MAGTRHLQPQLATALPALQTKTDMNPTLIVSWFCTIFSLVVILIRVCGRWVRTERLFREDKIMLWSIIPLVLRMAFVHPVLIWGTNNTTSFTLTDQEIRNRSIGSRLVLASRVFYALYIWTAKVTVLEFVRKIIGTTWTRFYERAARIIYAFFGLTFVAVLIATFAECRPFKNYWMVVPDPGPSCRTGSAQLITMGTCDIVTDVVLIAFPIPLVIMSRMPALKKISLVSLFLLSLVLIAVTAYRMPATIDRHYSQQFRSLLASLEILAATSVANIIVIGSFLRDKGVKKVKFRGGSMDEDDDVEGSVLSRPATRTIAQRHWGSDEDLVRGLGLTVSRELRHDSMTSGAVRPALTIEAASTQVQNVEPVITPQGRGLLDPAWTFRKGSAQVPRRRDSSVASTNSSRASVFKLQELHTSYSDHDPASPGADPGTPYKKMSFFDVGGLVDGATSEQPSLDYSRRISQQHTSSPVSRSHANFLTDIGGMLGPKMRREDVASPASSSGTNSQRSRLSFSRNLDNTHELHERTQRSGVALPVPHDAVGPDSLNIADAGGLLA